MNEQEITKKFDDLKRQGKIKSEIDAFLEGIIYQIEIEKALIKKEMVNNGS